MKLLHAFSASLCIFTFLLNGMEQKKAFTFDVYGNATLDATAKELSDKQLPLIAKKIAVLLSNGHSRALWIKTSITPKLKEQELKAIGFEVDHVETDRESGEKYLFWLRKNGVDMPLFGTATVGAGGIIIRSGAKGEEVLLTRIRYRESQGWEVPGGGVELGESLETAALRETKEETGLDGKINYLAAQVWRSQCYRGILNNLHCYFIMELASGCSGDTIAKESNEVKEVRWAPLRTLIENKETPENKIRTGVLMALMKHMGHQKKSHLTLLDYRQQGKKPEEQNKTDTMDIYLFDKPSDGNKTTKILPIFNFI